MSGSRKPSEWIDLAGLGEQATFFVAQAVLCYAERFCQTKFLELVDALYNPLPCGTLP